MHLLPAQEIAIVVDISVPKACLPYLKMACHSVGFNVVHHLTDLPKVLSGDQLLHFL